MSAFVGVVGAVFCFCFELMKTLTMGIEAVFVRQRHFGSSRLHCCKNEREWEIFSMRNSSPHQPGGFRFLYRFLCRSRSFSTSVSGLWHFFYLREMLGDI